MDRPHFSWEPEGPVRRFGAPIVYAACRKALSTTENAAEGCRRLG